MKERQLQYKIEFMVAKVCHANEIDLYYDMKPRYIPSFLYKICLRRFVQLELSKPGIITHLVKDGMKVHNDEIMEKLKNEADKIGCDIIPR